MKKIILVLALALVWGSSDVYAQKKNVAKAKAKMNAETPDYVAAKEAIEPALQDSTTDCLADTWFTAGKIYYKLFDDEQKKEWAKQKYDPELEYSSLRNAFDCFIVADSLDQTPNAKGKVANKFRKQIVEIAAAMQNGFINAGGYYYKQAQNSEDSLTSSQMYMKAVDNFEYYLKYTDVKYWPEEKQAQLEADTMRYDIMYYCGAAATQANESRVALKYFSKLFDIKPIEENFQFIVYEYGRLQDSVMLMELYKTGVQKFPSNPMYARSLINEYLKRNELGEALVWIERAIADGDSGSVFWNLKGQILEHEGKLDEAVTAFAKAVEVNPEDADALGNLGRIYYNQAVEERDRVYAIRDNKKYEAAKKKLADWFRKPLPYLEKAHELNPQERDNILALRTIYYNLGKGYEKKYEEMDKLMNATR